MRFEVNTFREKFSSLGWKSVEVGSVHQFQGKEKLVVIISTVRSSSKSNPSMKNSLGFLTNPKQFNVAVTRARALLIVVGNPCTLSRDRCWNQLLTYCQQNSSNIGVQNLS
ncbi:probable RNA helicase SDE3 [Homalodisca vitripennis]|uniref:probable RNA helicase SDE3 n=1 Tax=Homalodisca vitripennis TaxID=197043 RepID=UPI001EEB29A2|nr:probable RNA helicase SDE3 [Homalodisca vitripennis]